MILKCSKIGNFYIKSNALINLNSIIKLIKALIFTSDISYQNC